MKKLNLVGERFGKLLVIKEVNERRRGYIYWECCCDCGNIRYVRTCSLRSGDSPSCECLSRERIRNLKKLPDGQASFNSLFGSYKRSAKKRGYNFELTDGEFRALTKSNCHYCGCEPSTEYKSPENTGSCIYNGIDKVDNSKGYHMENCVPCCKICNRMKQTMSKEDFLRHVEKILNYTKVIKELFI